MYQLSNIEPVNYLFIGHITCDLTDRGPEVGGAAAYGALTAQALGLRVGIVTSFADDLDLSALGSIPLVSIPSDCTTTFHNIDSTQGRIQTISTVAANLDYSYVPEVWRNTSIVHLCPIAKEVDPAMINHFSSSLVGVTPQGWMRNWDGNGQVSYAEWNDASYVLERAGAVVISMEDVGGIEERIEDIVSSARILAVTEGAEGVRIYWIGDVRRFRPPPVQVVDTTGAGDIFATAFFTRLYTTRDPWEAARFATQLSARSVTRAGLNGVPTQNEIRECMVEVF